VQLCKYIKRLPRKNGKKHAGFRCSETAFFATTFIRLYIHPLDGLLSATQLPSLWS
jgi:hypothetical protein